MVDLIERLSTELDHATPEDDAERADLIERLSAAQALGAEIEDYAPDYHYGETVIRDDYFEQYARDFADDIGAVDREAGWPNSFIDWPAAAEALQIDYASFEFDGCTWWVGCTRH